MSIPCYKPLPLSRLRSLMEGSGDSQCSQEAARLYYPGADLRKEKLQQARELRENNNQNILLET